MKLKYSGAGILMCHGPWFVCFSSTSGPQVRVVCDSGLIDLTVGCRARSVFRVVLILFSLSTPIKCDRENGGAEML